MADDIPPFKPESDLPAPDRSSFFAPTAGDQPEGESGWRGSVPSVESEAPDAQPPAEAGSDSAQPPAEGSPDSVQPPAEPAAIPPFDPSAGRPPSQADLGATEPHDFASEIDPAALQYTQMLPLVGPAEPAEIPPFDPNAAQLTQVMAVVTPAGAEAAPVFSPAPTTVVAGSRVVLLVSRGVSPVPPSGVATVPHVIGLPQSEALSRLQEAALSVQVFNECSGLPRGEVLAQMPAYGQNAVSGSEAVLLVSGGPAPAASVSVPLPEVIGLSEADACARVQNAGLLPQVVRDFSATVPLGVVIDQLPTGQAVAQRPQKKRSLWWLWLLLVLAVLFAVAGGAYYYLNRTAAVPNVVGLTQTQAEQTILSAGFELGSITMTQTISASEVGKVTTQTPPPNTELKLVDQVDMTVSGGQKLFSVPEVIGKPQAEARSILASAGLEATATQAYSPIVPKDSVISQSPPSSDKVPYGTTVGLVVSLGVQSVTVPGVGGQTQSQAANSLKAANLSSQAVIEYTLTGTAKGLVFAQYPTAGMMVAPGTIVGVLVSNGPPSSGSTSTVSVPSVVGQSLSSARSALSKVSLGNTVINWSGTGRPVNEVVGQAPEAGAIMPKKTAVVLFISNGK
ncbi:MAG TPA: PASTA domain-containing protein [Candidatus Limnocylindrales bacterium]